MKKCLFITLAVITVIRSVAQSDDQKIFSFGNYSPVSISVPEPAPMPVQNSSVNRISVIDFRYHSTILGFSTKYYLITDSQFTAVAERYINLSTGFIYRPDTGAQLLAVIKKLWITQESEIDSTGGRGGITFTVDCFFKRNEQYFPAFRYDTSFIISDNNIIQGAPGMIDNCLQGLVRKITGWMITGTRYINKPMSLLQVQQYYAERFEIPVFQDSIVRKGIYQNFEEFKSNKPSITNFTSRRGKKTSELYAKDAAGRETLIRDAWGYCDGTNYFIRSYNNYYQLTRVANTFYLQGIKEPASFIARQSDGLKSAKRAVKVLPYIVNPYTLKGLASINALNALVNGAETIFPYQLDMESGKIQ